MDTVLLTVSGKLLQGSVTSDRTRDQKYSATVTLVNDDGSLTPEVASLVSLWRLVRLERGAIVGTQAQYRSLMTGLLDQPSTALGKGAISFTVWSRTRLADKQFDAPMSFLAGTRVKDVIRAIAEAGGLGTDDDWYQLADGGATLAADRAYDISDNMLRSITELAFNHALEFFDDGDGKIILKPITCTTPDCTDNLPHPAYVDVALGSSEPVWTFDVGLLGRETSLQGRQPINRQVVVGTGPDLYPIRAEWRDLNPLSPTYNPTDGTGPLGDLPGVPYISAEIRTQAQANAVAMQLGYERNLIDETGQASAIPIPLISAGSVVKFGDDAVLLDSVTIPLGPGEMSMTWRGTRSLTA